jgi:hypothetical protein
VSQNLKSILIESFPTRAVSGAQRKSIGEGGQQFGVLFTMGFAARFCQYDVSCRWFF